MIESKEKLFCYEIFREYYNPPKMKEDEKACNLCRYPAKRYAMHCSYCGNYPIVEAKIG